MAPKVSSPIVITRTQILKMIADVSFEPEFRPCISFATDETFIHGKC